MFVLMLLLVYFTLDSYLSVTKLNQPKNDPMVGKSLFYIHSEEAFGLNPLTIKPFYSVLADHCLPTTIAIRCAYDNNMGQQFTCSPRHGGDSQGHTPDIKYKYLPQVEVDLDRCVPVVSSVASAVVRS